MNTKESHGWVELAIPTTHSLGLFVTPPVMPNVTRSTAQPDKPLLVRLRRVSWRRGGGDGRGKTPGLVARFAHYGSHCGMDWRWWSIEVYGGKKRSKGIETIPMRLEMGDNRGVAPAFFVCLKRDGAANWQHRS